MIKNISFVCLSFLLGYYVGYYIQNKKFERRKDLLLALQELVKRRNNQMVENFATLYSLTEHDETRFTEVDEMLSSMWMD